ncbi:LysM peptidoglycan-binding domain-containing protein [Dyella lutea]|uniref:LysM peptidoglycan-binding domain-containing protein n=1 Tax=Dyella lutea TaxID=2950441 RepID=A0ABT1F632_9GAMM|nr:LysM domain-containing protein [Dyella lutea]MCP1372605.1 LysM peptidoglycan-binding domain-containing protein [Dyella lutea]
MIKKSIGLLAGMLVTVAVYAAGAQLRASHPDTYTVHRGDTLWGISAKFLSKPWLWPEIWQANPQVHNPHLIYPGDVLNLSFINGPSLKLEPGVHAGEEPVPAIPLSDLSMFLKDMRVVNSNELNSTPYVVGLEEARLAGAPGQNVYVRNLNSQPGQRWAIVRPTHVFRGYGKGDDRDLVAHPLDADVSTVRGPWSEDFRNDGHYGRGDDLGVEVTVIGTAETLRTGDVSTLLLLDSTREVRKGDRVMPIDDQPYDAYYYPHAPKSVPQNARVIAIADALDADGKLQVVALSIGKQDGVENGQTYAVWQPGETIADDVAGDSWDRGTSPKVTLPEEFAGHVMVFRTFDKVSYALIMDSLKPVKNRDTLRMPE